MQCYYKFLAFVVANALRASAALPQNEVLHEEPQLPLGWKATVEPAVPDEEIVALQFIVKPSNIIQLYLHAYNVSNPNNRAYGHYLSKDEVNSLTAPTSSHVAAVEGWLERAAVAFQRTHNTVEATMKVSSANALLQTKFSYVTQDRTGRRVLRATSYTLPQLVDDALSAIYGLHGLPLSSTGTRTPRVSATSSGEPAKVTPAVLAHKYGITGVKPLGSLKNRQAVAEFQGEAMKDSDLKKFFKKYIPSAPTNDSIIHKFVGDPGESDFGGIEASLDVDYIMGVAPGLLTEFWYWKSNDFCKDLKNWTSTILAQDQPPLVHSVSYGFQGDLSDVGCPTENVRDVDLNFVKLAARGISIIFASGDSGSGYERNLCSSSRMLRDTAVQGTALETRKVRDERDCCFIAGSKRSRRRPGEEPEVKAWTYSPPSMMAAGKAVVAGRDGSGASPRQLCSPKKGLALNGTVQRALPVPKIGGDATCCRLASEGIPTVVGYTFLVGGTDDYEGKCVLFKTIEGSTSVSEASSSRIELGTCTLFADVNTKSAQEGFVSGGSALAPQFGKMWPSWPASSPWVTAVGSTRFIHQKYSKPEMATDQFGSGGGFSMMFPAFQQQESFVKHYLQTAPGLPPPGLFPPGGRATPDVSALGEGFRVIANSQDESVGGTSASAPTFAGIVSLLNEARMQAGKPPMGYLNPWLYAHPNAFNDITKGTDKIGRGGEPLKYGFSCTKGWDPVTGLGTPNFPKMLRAAMALGGGAGDDQELFVV